MIGVTLLVLHLSGTPYVSSAFPMNEPARANIVLVDEVYNSGGNSGGGSSGGGSHGGSGSTGGGGHETEPSNNRGN